MIISEWLYGHRMPHSSLACFMSSEFLDILFFSLTFIFYTIYTHTHTHIYIYNIYLVYKYVLNYILNKSRSDFLQVRLPEGTWQI